MYFGTTFFVWISARRVVHELLQFMPLQRKCDVCKKCMKDKETAGVVETTRALLDEALAAFLFVAWNFEAYNQFIAFGDTAYGVALLLTGLVHYATNTEANPCYHLTEYVPTGLQGYFKALLLSTS